MSNVTLRWIGDLDQDKREQAGCVSSSSDQYRPKKIELKPGQKEIRIGRMNTKAPPDYPIESCINSRMISRNHATIERSAKGGPILYDHSMNGTYVNYIRVIGSATLKHGDVVCFGHLNGANLKPGESVALFYSDLKYRVELSGAPPSNDATVNATSAKKKKPHPLQPGSTVSSTQHSDGDDLSADSGDENKRPRGSTSLSKSSTSASRHKSFKKPVNSVGKRKAEDVDEEDNDVDSGDDDDENDFEDSSAGKRVSKLFKKRSNGTEKNRKPVQHGSSFRKLSVKTDHHGKDKRSRKSGKSGCGTGVGGHDTDGDDMFHYDSEECSARPCKQPQDVAIDWIQCDKCTLWYHQVCVGLKPSEANVDTYYCPACKK